jgi:menaquinone-dependent protoporphyrinogen oxidase
MSTTTDKFTAQPSCQVPVFYATTEGQTRRIAERLAASLRAEHLDSRAIDMAGREAAAIDWAGVRGAIVGASLHAGRHQKAADLFVRGRATELNRRPSAFFSVSLSAASRNPAEVEAAAQLAKAFPAACGWQPQIVASVAGRLAYTEYNFFIRLIMKRIARKEGAPTDTSRDYELTNWADVDRLARDFAARIEPTPKAAYPQPHAV